jgi:WG repeat protein
MTKLRLEVANGKCGFVDAKGRWVIPAVYEDAEAFCEGVAAATKSAKWGYIDERGRLVMPAKFSSALNFHKGRAMVNVRLHHYNPIINKGGNIPETTVLGREGLAHLGNAFFSEQFSEFSTDHCTLTTELWSVKATSSPCRPAFPAPGKSSRRSASTISLVELTAVSYQLSACRLPSKRLYCT